MTDKEKKELALREKEPIAKQDGEPTRAGLVYSPTVDIVRSDEAITIVADLPGVRKADLDVRIEDGVLTIAAPVAEVEARHKPVYREYGVGGYARRFILSDKIDQARIAAELEDGVLRVTLPKAERLKPRKIEIGAG
jgi:HSP20 family molecular chaperone IbpA